MKEERYAMHSPTRWALRGGLTLKAILLLGLICGPFGIAKAQSFQDAPFELGTTAFSPGYIGYDPEAFIKTYDDLSAKEQQERRKDEFETTAAYEKRLKELDAQNPFMNNTYAFAAMPTTVSYDADTQTFTLEFNPGSAPHNVKYASTLLEHGAKDMGHYEAENGFGATFTVEKSLVFTYQLWLSKAEGSVGCKAAATVALADARSMKSDIRALLVIRPLPPYASVDTSYTEATFSEPTEDTLKIGTIYGRILGVRFYDWSTGQILASCP